MSKELMLAERFWSKIDFGSMAAGSPCLEWKAGHKSGQRTGYGNMLFNGKYEPAQRIAWMLQVGPIPNGLCVLHSCDNKSCVRIEHLYLGTQSRNLKDAVIRGRMAPPRITGAANPASKLSARDVAVVRRYCSMPGRGRQAKAARRFSVSRTTISRIVRGVNWVA